MAEYDPSREVKLIELAWKVVDPLIVQPSLSSPEEIIELKTKWFDKAYKALSKTVLGK